MYPGVGPDGVYRLHAGVHNDDYQRRDSVSRTTFRLQLAEGGSRLDQSVLNFFTTRRRRAEGQILMDAAYAAREKMMDQN